MEDVAIIELISIPVSAATGINPIVESPPVNGIATNAVVKTAIVAAPA